MGRLAFERHITFHYIPEFVAHWNEQPAELKTLMNNLGRPYGYTGINVFYVFYVQYWAHGIADTERKEWRHAL